MDNDPFWVAKVDRWIFDGYVDIVLTGDDDTGELSARLDERQAEILRDALNEFLG